MRVMNNMVTGSTASNREKNPYHLLKLVTVPVQFV